MNNLDKLCQGFMDALEESIMRCMDGHGGMSWHGKEKACEALKILISGVVNECKEEQ